VSYWISARSVSGARVLGVPSEFDKRRRRGDRRSPQIQRDPSIVEDIPYRIEKCALPSLHVLQVAPR
jgi:hypothetical protein